MAGFDTTFAAIADIHGNRWALEAVLEDLDRLGISTVVNLGDHLAGPLDHVGTARLLQSRNFPSVSGNQDRELVAAGSPHAAWLATMPFTLACPGSILLFHGTPRHDTQYLLETVHPAGQVTLTSDQEIAEHLGPVSQTLLLCGHTHIPRVVATAGRTIVNPGSVGLQAYEDDAPHRHLMETGSPEARYALLEPAVNGWRVNLRSIPYDHKSAAQCAISNGRSDWAHRLRTGRAR